jgi:SAM-dependent methyltransferase
MVLTRHVLHHVEDIGAVAAKIFRSLKKGGVAIFLEPNPLCVYWYPYLTFHPHRSWKVEHGILRCFPWMLKRHFVQAGFSEIELMNYGAFPPFVVNKMKSLIPLDDRICSVPMVKRLLALTLLRVKK